MRAALFTLRTMPTATTSASAAVPSVGARSTNVLSASSRTAFANPAATLPLGLYVRGRRFASAASTSTPKVDGGNVTSVAESSSESPPPKSPWNRYNRMWFPEETFTMVGSTRVSGTRRVYAFRVSPKRTKHEIKDYIQTVYGLKVLKVNTANYQEK